MVGLLSITLLPATTAAALNPTKPAQDQIPPRVMQSLMAKFPKARIDVWTKEVEDGVTLYDIEFKQDGRRFEADIKADGVIHNWEREVAAADVPAAVRQTEDGKILEDAEARPHRPG